jgi:hypothetical protein
MFQHIARFYKGSIFHLWTIHFYVSPLFMDPSQFAKLHVSMKIGLYHPRLFKHVVWRIVSEDPLVGFPADCPVF